MGWSVQPDGLRRLLVRLHAEYSGPAGVDLYVTENGAAYDDQVAEDGQVHDAERTTFLVDHLAAVLDTVDEGVPVHGYFYWSLMDNFEWAWGYTKRFGVVRVDYDTQRRTVKDSGRAYAQIIADRALPS
jgi:beta-glucosidase/6-phospho-beta-glucosidase/beta-galactosidase